MADGNDEWFSSADDGPAPPEAGDLLRKLSTISQTSPAAAAALAAETGAGEADLATDYFDPDRVLLCKHWIRPKFQQYKYLLDYRLNYYDDVIDYLDKKQRGMLREIPRPQTWAERALRTCNNHRNKRDFYRSLDEDKKLAASMKLAGLFYHHHNREYLNRKYSSIL